MKDYFLVALVGFYVVLYLPLYIVWTFGKASDIIHLVSLFLSIIAVGFIPLVSVCIHEILTNISNTTWFFLALSSILMTGFLFYLCSYLYEEELKHEEPLYSLRFASFKSSEEKKGDKK